MRQNGHLMRMVLRGLAALVLAVWTAGAIDAQITSNPIPAPIEKRGLAVEIMDLARLPDTRGIRPADQDVKPAGWARVNYVRDLPDGRRFANDSRGFLYLIDSNNQPQVYANVGGHVSACGLQPAGERIHRVCLSSGVRAKRPVLHRARGARARAIRRRPTSSRPGSRLKDVTYHNIITEWHATNPGRQRVRGHQT